MKNNHAILVQVLLLVTSIVSVKVWADGAMNPYVVMILAVICTASLVVSIKSEGTNRVFSMRSKLAEASVRPFVLFFSAIHMLVLLVAASLIA